LVLGVNCYLTVREVCKCKLSAKYVENGLITVKKQLINECFPKKNKNRQPLPKKNKSSIQPNKAADEMTENPQHTVGSLTIKISKKNVLI
jgi:hypothetical protein